MTRKVLVVTGTRAEFGLLRGLMTNIVSAPNLELQLIATGMHLSPRFGSTYTEIEEAGFGIDLKIDLMLEGDSPEDISKSIGFGMTGFAKAYKKLQPDLVIVLGDRFELLPAVISALISVIPVAHLHGGEITEGAFDESIRHAVTKMSHLHFVATDEYRKRVIQLGENPDHVYNVGGLGVDAIKRTKLMTRLELENSLGFTFGERNLLITFHPATLEQGQSIHQLNELLAALHRLQDTKLLFTLPNADTGSRQLIGLINRFVASHPHSRAYPSLGQLRYLSCMSIVDGVVGNSSSGIAEAPTLKTGTVNIGNRQKGRLMAASVINCSTERDAISHAIARLYDRSFRHVLNSVKNPYGDGGAAERIVGHISEVELQGLEKKPFYDLNLK